MKTLAEQLRAHLKNEWEWHHKGQLLRMEWRNPKNKTLYMSETIGRTLRTLEADRVIAVKPDDNGKSVMYKWLDPDRRKLYIPWSDRPLNAKRVLFKEA